MFVLVFTQNRNINRGQSSRGLRNRNETSRTYDVKTSCWALQLQYRGNSCCPSKVICTKIVIIVTFYYSYAHKRTLIIIILCVHVQGRSPRAIIIGIMTCHVKLKYLTRIKRMMRLQTRKTDAKPLWEILRKSGRRYATDRSTHITRSIILYAQVRYISQGLKRRIYYLFFNLFYANSNTVLRLFIIAC